MSIVEYKQDIVQAAKSGVGFDKVNSEQIGSDHGEDPSLVLRDIEAMRETINKEQKHTPGPWKLSKEVTKGEFVTDYLIRSNDQTMVAQVGPSKQEANARLIAAAPEMLEALKTYIRNFDEMKYANNDDDRRRLLDAQVNNHSNVRRLIAKAEGGEL